MAEQNVPILIENITYYEEAEVVVLTPPPGSSPSPKLTFRGQPAAGQFRDLKKKLKSEADLTDPILIGDREVILAPTLTIDEISGPVFWEEIVRLNSKV